MQFLADNKGTDKSVGLTYKDLPKQLEVGDELLLSDALIKLEVTKIEKSKIITKVIRGGKLKPYQGVNKKGGGLSLKGITEKDKKDLAKAVKLDIDYVAVSFVKDADDIKAVKKVIGKKTNWYYCKN
jgi:pyruvate kinase